MKALFPAAGFATRLYPLTQECPKALLPLGSVSSMQMLLSAVNALPAVDEAIVISNAKFYEQFAHWKATHATIPVRVLNDGVEHVEQRRGTVGDLWFALRELGIDDDVLIINADNVFSFDLRPFHAFFEEKRNVVGMRAMKEQKEAASFGALDVDSQGKIISFREKDPAARAAFCSLGIYALSRETLPLIGEYLAGSNAPDRTGDFIAWLSQRIPVYGFAFPSDRGIWFDIGTPEEYAAAQEAILRMTKQR